MPGATRTKRTADVSVTVNEADTGPYESFLIRATNNAGKSKYTILDAGEVCYRCT